MPPRRKQQFTQENIDQQLQQIHLLDPSSSSENLEQLGPIIKQIHTNRQQDAYLRTIQGLIDSKDTDIEKICSDNYQDFISSVSTLFTVKSYTDKMKENISSLDNSVAQLGGSLVEKKRALLQSKKTAANLDEAIDTLQACLRVLDVVNRVGEMIGEGKYWSALRVCRCCCLYQLPIFNTIAHRFFIVARGHPKYASDFIIANTVLPTSSFLLALPAKSNQGCCNSFHETMASRDQKCKHRGWSVGFWSNGSSNPEMASSPWEGSSSPFKSSWQRSGTSHIREDRMWALIY